MHGTTMLKSLHKVKYIQTIYFVIHVYQYFIFSLPYIHVSSSAQFFHCLCTLLIHRRTLGFIHSKYLTVCCYANVVDEQKIFEIRYSVHNSWPDNTKLMVGSQGLNFIGDMSGSISQSVMSGEKTGMIGRKRYLLCMNKG